METTLKMLEGKRKDGFDNLHKTDAQRVETVICE